MEKIIFLAGPELQTALGAAVESHEYYDDLGPFMRRAVLDLTDRVVGGSVDVRSVKEQAPAQEVEPGSMALAIGLRSLEEKQAVVKAARRLDVDPLDCVTAALRMYLREDS